MLFVVCPFSSLEFFIRSKYNNDALFLTFAGAVLQATDIAYWDYVKKVIEKENISTICLVNDTSCRFINGVIRDEQPFGLPSENAFRMLYKEHYEALFQGRTLFQQQVKLAELNIKNQMSGIFSIPVIGDMVADARIAVKGMIVSKERDMLVEVSSKKKSNLIYEF